jgi:hypothetical protein
MVRESDRVRRFLAHTRNSVALETANALAMKRRAFPMAVCIALPGALSLPIPDPRAAASGRTVFVVVFIGMVA